MAVITRSTPAGCIIMLTGFAALIYGGLAGFALWKIARAADPAKYEEIRGVLVWHCGVASALGIVLLVLGWRLSKNVRVYDREDLDD